GGRHTSDTPFSVLIPAIVDLCKDAKSPLMGEPIIIVAASGIADGWGLTTALSYSASGVWVGTCFMASIESRVPPLHKQLVVLSGYDDTVKTLVYSGRPMHIRKTCG
ncbi:2-nitropropane dioxygenase, partial [Lactarius pseudohatsudake]